MSPKRKLLFYFFIALNVLIYSYLAWNIWGGGGTKVSSGKKPGKKHESSFARESSKTMSDDTFLPLSRNPFRSSGMGSGAMLREVRPSGPAAPLKPDIRLSGIMFDESDSLAIVEDLAASETKKVKVGDVVKETKILEIKRDEIVVQKNGIRYKITSDSYEEIAK